MCVNSHADEKKVLEMLFTSEFRESIFLGSGLQSSVGNKAGDMVRMRKTAALSHNLQLQTASS
jgi:hypothetical protein